MEVVNVTKYLWNSFQMTIGHDINETTKSASIHDFKMNFELPRFYTWTLMLHMIYSALTLVYLMLLKVCCIEINEYCK
jgi:hypothetical protein